MVESRKVLLEDQLEQLKPQLIAYLRQKMAPELQRVHGADDIAQEACICAHIEEKSGKLKYRNNGALYRWLQCRASYIVGEKQRKEKPARSVDDSSLALAETLVKSGLFRPSQIISQEEQIELLHSKLQNLKDNEREVVVRRELNGQTFKEIGLSLGISEGHAARLYKKALEKLRHMLDAA